MGIQTIRIKKSMYVNFMQVEIKALEENGAVLNWKVPFRVDVLLLRDRIKAHSKSERTGDYFCNKV